jgi:hypothetical protein
VLGQRGQADELQIGESGLEHEVGRDRELDRIRAQQHLVECVARGDGDPVVGMIEAVRPVEAGVAGDQVVHQLEGDLRVPELVEGAQQRHAAPRPVTAEACRAEIADHGGELRQRQRGRVQLHRAHPTRVEPRRTAARQRLANGDHRRLLLRLHAHVVDEGGAKLLLPSRPIRVRQPRTSAARLGKEVAGIDVARLPVELPRQRHPIVVLHRRRRVYQDAWPVPRQGFESGRS